MNSRCLILGLMLAFTALYSCAGIEHESVPRADQVARSTPATDAVLSTIRTEPESIELVSLQEDVQEVIRDLERNREGEVYAAAVEGTNADDLVIAVALVDGRHFEVGNATVTFPLMSVSKPFTYALALEQRGANFLLEKIGVDATGMPYNSILAGAARKTTEQNPMVNAGAIATHSYIEGDDPVDKTRRVVALYSDLANEPLRVEDKWRVPPRPLSYALAYQMQADDRLQGDVADTVNRYLEANIVAVDPRGLAQMGASLASGGIQPVTGKRILKPETTRLVLSAMTIAGMYEDSGLWWAEVGVPAKSGVCGAILAVVPGWGAVMAYSPRLDAAGNSVRGAIAIRRLVERWRLHTMDRLIEAYPSVVQNRSVRL